MGESFIRRRILWRAAKHRLLEKRCIVYSDASSEQSTALNAALGECIDGVLLFWDCSERWTILTETLVASWHDGKLHRSSLDSIDRQISVPSLAPDAQSQTKQEAEYLWLEKSGQLIWAPNGVELFALMNLLRMFPLGGSAASRESQN